MEAAVTTPVSPPMLPYADLPSRWGVVIDRSPTGIRIVIPPAPSWRALGKGFHVGVPLLLGWMLYATVLVVRSGEVVAQVFNVFMYGTALACVLLVAAGRLRRRLLFEVNATHFSFAFMNTRRVLRRWTWPRGKIVEVKVNAFNGKLIVRVAGEDSIELYAGPYREVAAMVAATVSAALGEPFAASSGDAVPDTQDAPTGVARAALLAVGTLFLAIALGIVIYPWPYRPFAFYALIAAGVPFGLAYGTQDKKFFA